MRFARRTALVLVLSLLAVIATVPTGGTASSAEPIHAAQSGADALSGRHEALQGNAFRLERDHRRDTPASQRSLKHLLALAVLVTAVFAVFAAGTRVVLFSFRPPLTTWWFRSGGRAPPLLQPSFV